MFSKRSDAGYVPALDGIERKTLVHGDKTLMTEFRLRAGSLLPRHAHPHEQTGFLVSSRIRLSIGTEEHEARDGDSWCIPGGVEHGADILEDSVAIEVFSPVRDDYLPGSDLRDRNQRAPAPLAASLNVEGVSTGCAPASISLCAGA
jgi:quercetin dioxygenase-like cupin family protein